MQTHKVQFFHRVLGGLLPRAIVLSCSLIAATTAHAFDPDKAFKPDDEPQNIVRYGVKALKNGHVKKALDAFRYGAENNNLASQWKLARMLQLGKHMPKNDMAAYRLYSKIDRRFAERIPLNHERGYISNAMVQLAKYHQTGIKNSAVNVNYRLAEDYFLRAAALYHDPEAQYELGMLYRRGDLGTKKPRHAARWFGLSARKGHAMAQAQLGEMLFYGDGVPKNPVRGLVFMTRAISWSPKNTLHSIRAMRERALQKASDTQRQAVDKIMANMVAIKRKSLSIVSGRNSKASHFPQE